MFISEFRIESQMIRNNFLILAIRNDICSIYYYFHMEAINFLNMNEKWKNVPCDRVFSLAGSYQLNAFSFL